MPKSKPLVSADGATWWVKADVAKKWDHVICHHDCYSLVNNYSFTQHLHNEQGAALVAKDGNKTYWLEGKNYSFETWSKKVFHNKLSKVIFDDDSN